MARNGVTRSPLRGGRHWNDSHDPRSAVQSIEDTGAHAEAHWLWQLTATKVAHMGYLVIRSPGVATDHIRSKEQNYVVLVWLGVDTDEFTSDYVKAGLLEHL